MFFIKIQKAVARNLVVLTPVKSQMSSKQSVLEGRDTLFNGVNVTQLNETVNYLNYFYYLC